MRKSIHPELDKNVDGSVLFCKRCETVLEDNFFRDVREFEAEIFWAGQWGHEIGVGNVHGHELYNQGQDHAVEE